MHSQIKVEYVEKSKKLAFTVGFHLNDVIREFPSRRFDPKTKRWLMPLVAANMRHLESVRHKYDFQFTEPASIAVNNYEALNIGPVHVPFPVHIYKFPDHQPFEHQMLMLNNAWGLECFAWFAHMGTGKTYATIHYALAKWLGGEIDQVCIVCPSTLRRTWRKELKKYCHAPYVYRIHDPKDASYERWLTTPRDKATLRILAVSVEGLGVSENLWKSASKYLVVGRTLTIVDESSRIKNHKALRTQRCIEMGAESTLRGILNGTPIALGLHDLWAQFEFLSPNILGCGDYYAFKSRYIETGGFEGKQIVGYTNVDELMDLLKPYTTIVPKEVLNLMPKIPKTRWVGATKEQKALFKLIIKGSTGERDEPLIKVENTLERTLRLRQVVGGWLPEGKIVKKMIEGEDEHGKKIMLEAEVIETTVVPLKENPKMDDLFELIEDHNLGSKFTIWSTFIHEIEWIRDELARKYGPDSVRAYYGKTEQEDRSAIEDAYCNDPSMRYFIGNPTAAGLGLTLISGESDVVVYYSGTSAFIDRTQSEDRSHRIGQQNPVVVIDLAMENSVDLIMMDSIARKMDISDFVKERLASGEKIIDLLNRYHDAESD